MHLPDSPRPAHLARLKSIWRSAGWPCHDPIELDLIAADWIATERDHDGRESLRLTAAGVQLLIAARQKRIRSDSPHDRLAARVCAHLVTQGRIVWRELSLRAQVSAEAKPVAASASLDFTFDDAKDVGLPARALTEAAAWRMARPDIFSIRNTSVEHYLQPIVHEIKASRADLLSDLRNAAKREAYRWLSCETYYVFPQGLADPSEIPDDLGILTVNGTIADGTLELVRPARHAPCVLPFAVWMALARTTPNYEDDQETAQAQLTVEHAHEQS